MASSSGASASASGGSAQEVLDLRKRKRMLSNRESARRSRQRKQKHLDDLVAQANQLRKENGHIVAALSVTTQQYLAVEADNSVLRTQMTELTNRLQSLKDILTCMRVSCYGDDGDGDDGLMMMMMMMKQQPWSMVMPVANQQPIRASTDVYQYCS